MFFLQKLWFQIFTLLYANVGEMSSEIYAIDFECVVMSIILDMSFHPNEIV
jgi:hypothetical protein